MEAAILSFDGKVPVAEIPDPEGVLHEYDFVRPACWPPPALWLCRYVKRSEPREGETYTVCLLPRGVWSCTCRDQLYRFRRNRGGRLPGEPCKHICHAKGAKKLLEAVR